MEQENLTADQASWTVRDADGVDHRAVQQGSGTIRWVITACPWWKTHNVAGQKAPVRVDRVPTCLECTMLEIEAVGKPLCAHCKRPFEAHENNMTHYFEAPEK